MASDEEDNQAYDVRKMVAAQNRKKKKSGGFQSMGNWFGLLMLTNWFLDMTFYPLKRRSI